MSENCQNSLVYLLVISLENNNKKNRPKCSDSLHLQHSTMTDKLFIQGRQLAVSYFLMHLWFWNTSKPGCEWSTLSDLCCTSLTSCKWAPFFAFTAAFVIHYLSRGDNWQSKIFWCTSDPGIPANTVVIEYPFWPYCPSLTSCKWASFFQSTVQFA